MDCNYTIPSDLKTCCDTGLVTPEFSFDFKGGKCFNDGVYFGEIIERNEGLITVEYKGLNKYLKGNYQFNIVCNQTK